MSGSIDQDLGRIQEAADMDMSVIAGEESATAARRLSNAADAGQRPKSGDNAGSLLSDLFSDTDAQQEVEERKRKRAEAEAKKKAAEEEAARKRRLESVRRIAEENKRIEEMKARKAKMLAEMEKQRRIEEVGYDEEEEARKKAEEEARLKAEEEAAKAEEAEMQRQIAEVQANQAELDAKNKVMQAKKLEEERRARNKRNFMTAVASLVAVVLIGSLSYYFATKKAPDFYVLQPGYESMSITLEPIPQTGMTDKVFAMNTVVQEAPKAAVRTTKSSGTKKQNNEFAVTNVFSTGGGIVK